MEKTKDFLWTEQYRPKKISECILTEELKDTFTQFLKTKRNTKSTVIWYCRYW